MCSKYYIWGFLPQRILKLWVQSPNDDGISIVLALLPCLRSVPLAWKEIFSVDRILFEHHKPPISINYRPHSFKAANHLRILFSNILPSVLLKPIILGRHCPWSWVNSITCITGPQSNVTVKRALHMIQGKLTGWLKFNKGFYFIRHFSNLY